MRTRKYHTPMNLLLEPDMYTHIRMISSLEKISMSKFIREGIKLRLAQHDKENNVITTESSTDNEKIGGKS